MTKKINQHEADDQDDDNQGNENNRGHNHNNQGHNDQGDDNDQGHGHVSGAIKGTAGADTLMGTAGNDTIIALAGNDTITAGQGNDFVNGGQGVDTAVFTGNFADYNIMRHGEEGNIIVTDTVAGRDGTDKLVQVEQFAFADVTVNARTGTVVGAGENNVVVVHENGTFQSFDSVGAAVAAAANGETVFIGGGTFDTGSVLVDKDLTIIGSDTTQINGGFYIAAGGDGTTIDNLTINGGAAVAGESGNIGIFVQADNVTITDSTLVGDNNTATADRGILTSITDAQGLTISGNTIQDWNSGVYLNPGTDAQVTDNTFQNNFVALSADSDATADVTVTANNFNGSLFEQVGFGVIGAGDVENVGAQVFGNTFTGTAPQVDVYLYDPNQTVTASAATDTFVYTDNGVAGDDWTINAFGTASDHLELGAATVATTSTSGGDLTLTLSTGDELHLTGVTSFDPTWLV